MTITAMGVIVLIAFIVTNVLAAVLSYMASGRKLTKREKILTMIPRKLPGFAIGRSMAAIDKD